MRKLPVTEAVMLNHKAMAEHKQNPDYRYGQALYNILPKDITVEINGTEDDFFHWADNKKVTDHFFSKFVNNTNS